MPRPRTVVIGVVAFIGIGLAIAAAQAPGSRRPDAPRASTAAIGNLTGKFDLGSAGNATYRLSLTVPPGTGGAEPAISIEYDSQASDGYLGLGWALRGVSSITRCDASLALDGRRGGVTYGSADVFCLDGQRLIAVSQPGDGTAIYHTERETNLEVRSSAQRCGEGPCRFTALDQNGRALSFGATTGPGASRILAQGRTDGAVRVWAQDSVQDLNGNGIAFNYVSDPTTGEYYPTGIDYTANAGAGLAPGRSVRFAYQDRNDKLIRYVGGSRITISKLLVSVTTAVQNNTVLQYRLRYGESARTGRSLLQSVDVCDAAGECWPPLGFGWQGGSTGFADQGKTLPNALTVVVDNHSYPVGVLNDIDGDGILDYALATQFADGTADLRIWRGAVDGSFALQSYQLPGPLFRVTTQGVVRAGVLSDIEGIGRPDYSAAVENLDDPTKSDLTVWHNTGQGFEHRPDFKLPDPLVQIAGGAAIAAGVLADIDGDGIPDYSRATRFTNGRPDLLKIWKGTGTRFVDSEHDLPGPLYLVVGNQALPAGLLRDLNGDGVLDYSPATRNLNTGTDDLKVWVGASDFTFASPAAPPFDLPGPMFEIVGGSALGVGALVDLNGDGIPDYSPAIQKADGSSDLSVYLGTGTGYLPARFSLPGPLHLLWTPAGVARADVIGVLGDLDRDGFARYSAARKTDQGTDLSIWIGNSSGFQRAGYSLPDTLFVATGEGVFDNGILQDINGDGIPDFAHARAAVTEHGLIDCDCKLLLGSGALADLMISVTNAYGGTVAVSYAPLSSVQAASWSAAAWPVRPVSNPMYVVSGYTLGDGRDGSYGYSVGYAGALTDVSGRGWLGFRSIRTRELAGGRSHETTYNQNYPFQQTVAKRTSYDSAGQIMTTVQYQYIDIAAPARQAAGIHFVKSSEEITSHFAAGSSDYSMTFHDQYDVYGNLTLRADPGNPDRGDLSRWSCSRYIDDTDRHVLGMVEQTKQTSTREACQEFLSSSAPVWNPEADLRWSKQTYDANYNIATTSTYDNTKAAFITQQSAYDRFGNAIATTDAAGNISTRTFDAVFKTFAVTSTSPVLLRANGSTYTLLTLTDYEPGFGVLRRATDANGNVVSQEIDGFGRIKAFTGRAPDGSDARLTTTNWGRDETGFFIETRSRLDWNDGSVEHWPWVREYIDGIGRTYRRASSALNNGAPTTIVEGVAFDPEARASVVTQPHFDGDPAPTATATYDDWDRVVTMVDPAGTRTIKDYMPDGLHETVTVAAGTPDAQTSRIVSSPRGMTLQQTQPNGLVQSYVFDAVSQLTTVATAQSAPRERTLTWDSIGRLHRQVDSSIGSTGWTYDGAGRLLSVATDAGTASFAGYDALNRPTSRILTLDRGTSTTSLIYDDDSFANTLGRLSGTDTAAQNGLPSYSYRIGYDAFGDRAAQRVAIGTESYVVSETSTPHRAALTYTYPDGSTASYGYASDGLLRSIALQEPGDAAPRMLATFANRDAFNQILDATYDQTGVALAFRYFPVGDSFARLKSMKASRVPARARASDRARTPARDFVSLQYQWNQIDRLTSITDDLVPEKSERFGYADDPKNASMGFLTNAMGAYGQSQYRYDDLGNLVSHDDVKFELKPGTDRLASSSVGDTFDYDGSGRLISHAKTDTTSKYRFDAANQLVGIDHADADGIRSAAMAYDILGKRVVDTPLDQPTSHRIDERYELLRLDGGAAQGTKYVDGPLGLLSTLTRPATRKAAAWFVPGIHESHAALYGRGNLSGSIRHFWHAALAGILKSVLIVVVLPVVLLVVAGLAGLIWAVRSVRRPAATDLAQQHFLFFLCTPIVVVLFALVQIGPAFAGLVPGANGAGVPASGVLYFVQDHVGSTMRVLDDKGVTTGSVAYKPYGDIDQANSSGTDNFRRKFSGKEWNATARLYDFGARSYDPRIGRFLTPDPADQFFNPYIYAASSPVSAVDPDGQFVFLLAIAIGAYFGAASVNHAMNPLHWNFGSLKTYAGLAAGAAIGAVGAAAGAEVAEAAQALGASGGTAAALAGTTIGIVGAAAIGAAENVGFAALAGGDSDNLAESAGIGAALGVLGAGAGTLDAEGQGLETGSMASGEDEMAGGDQGSVADEDSCNSFPAGTMVWTSIGRLPIERVRTNDQVMARPAGDGEAALRPVGGRVFHVTTSLIELTIRDVAIRVTPEHRFWVEDAGWTAAKDLTAGARLRSIDGSTPQIDSTKLLDVPPTMVWNFEVEEAHTYFVSQLGLLVHNVTPIGAVHCKLSQIKPPRTASKKDQEDFRNKVKKMVKKFGDRPISYYDPKTGGRRQIDFQSYAIKFANKKADVSLASFGKGTTRAQHFAFADRQMSDISRAKFNRRNMHDWSATVKGIKGTWHHYPWTKRMVFVPREIHAKIGHEGGIATLFK